MHRDTIFENYRKDRWQHQIEHFKLETFPDLLRYTPQIEAEGLICFARLESATLEQRIAAEIAYFQEKNLDFEWKWYEFDQPANLQQRLAAHGFVADDEEAFMLYPLQQDTNQQNFTPEGAAQVVRVTDGQGLRDVLSVQEKVWGRQFDWLYAQIIETLTHQPQEIVMYCAYVDGQPVGSGWTDYPPNSQYPELHGGAVVDGYRGRGIYKDLYRARIAHAARAGYTWLAVDASPMSRPILEKLGFVHICMSVPMRYRRAQVQQA